MKVTSSREPKVISRWDFLFTECRNILETGVIFGVKGIAYSKFRAWVGLASSLKICVILRVTIRYALRLFFLKSIIVLNYYCI